MSFLYLGLHPTTAQPIVVKVLSPKFLKNKEMTGRFLKEAQIIAMTDHPNIVKLYGQGSWEKGLYIAMEFIRGISLRQFIQQKSLSHRRAIEIILQVAYALCHLHTHGVIHRDLKPENILITESGEIKVIDFGIAQLQGEPTDERITQTKRMMGTPTYMSPEQKEDPLTVTYATDIYSLGIIAYELILGRLSHGVIHLALLSKTLRSIIDKTLKTDPKERYQDIVDFITDISHYLKTLSDQKEEAPEEVSDEVLDMIQKVRAVLIPKKAPRWSHVEMGIAIQDGMSLSGLYLDSIRLPDNNYCLILAEPSDPSTPSLLQCAVLRGMCRAALSTAKKDLHPITLLTQLSQTLKEDPMHQKFHLSLLILSPEKNRLSFVSCNHTHLWHIPEGSKKVRVLSTPNPPLGSDLHTTLLETGDNWNSGDTLILHTHSKHDEGRLGWVSEHLLLSPQHLAEKVLHHYSSARAGHTKRAFAALVLHRLF